MTVLSILFDQQCTDSLTIHRDSAETIKLLDQLDSMLLERRQSIYIRRNVRAYAKDAIYIIKPKQAKYWNYSSACRDADDIFADVVKTWRYNDGQHS